MTEDVLYKLPIDELLDLMMKNTKELVELTHTLNKTDYNEKTKKLQLIQRIIIAKKAEISPG